MNEDEKITQILQVVSELKVEMTHLSKRMESRTTEIKVLSDRIARLETSFAINDSQMKKLDHWYKFVLGAIITILVGYVAVKLGLK